MAEVRVKVARTVVPTVADYAFGTLWSWSLYQARPTDWNATGYQRLVANGSAWTEKGARRKGERAARRALEPFVVEYEYNPEGLL